MEGTNMTWKRVLPIAVVTVILSVAPADAQFTKSWKDWYGNFGGGFTLPQGDAADVIKDGWNLHGGATYYPEEWAVGLSMGLEYHDFGVEREILDFFESSGGDVSIWGLTAGLTWSPKLDGGFGIYVNGGIGGYRTEARLTEPGYVCGPICPPWSIWCYPGCVPGTIITDSVSSTDFGYNLSLAITFEVGQGSMIYLEAKYTSIDTPETTELFPINVGYRW
jgi:hypothetical protein